MMQVEVKLHGPLRRYRPAVANEAKTTAGGGLPHHPFFVSLPANATIAMLIQYLQIPDGLVSAWAQNGEATEETAVLQEGDKIALFPPSAGG